MRIFGNPNKVDGLTLLKNKQLLCMTLDIISKEKYGIILSDEHFIADMKYLLNIGFCKGLIQNMFNYAQHEKIRCKHIKENDITFIIPIRIDSPERKRNVLLLIEQLEQIPNASVIILEADSKRRFKCAESAFISYYFIEDHDPVFYRTKYINMMLSEIKTKIAGIWDADIIVPCEQIISSIKHVQNGCIMSFPYDGGAFTLQSDVSEKYGISRSVSFLMENISNFSRSFRVQMEYVEQVMAKITQRKEVYFDFFEQLIGLSNGGFISLKSLSHILYQIFF